MFDLFWIVFFGIVAAIIAKKKASWVLYGIGAVINAAAFAAGFAGLDVIHKSLNADPERVSALNTQLSVETAIYIVLLVVFFFLIKMRIAKKNHAQSNDHA